MNGHVRFFLILAGVVALAALTAWGLTSLAGGTSFAKDGASLTMLITLALVLGSTFLLGGQIGLSTAVRSIIAWVGIALLLILGYSYRDDFSRMYHRVAGELSPGATTTGPDRVRISAAQDGHFYVDARINGKPVRLLVDTGATSTVLSQPAARAAGIDPGGLSYNIQVRTANGIVRAAVVLLDSFAIGNATLRNERVLVTERTGREMSVMGVRTLNRFNGYSVRNGVLTIFTR